MLYLIVIVGATLLVGLLNFAFGGVYGAEELGYQLFAAVFATGAVFAIDGILALAIRRLLPKTLFGPDNPLFAVSDKERRFYRKLRIHAWKDKVPEWGGFTGFHKDKLAHTDDSVYLGRFLLESNYGVVIHLVTAFWGYAILLLPFSGRLSVGLPIAVVNMLLNFLPTMILRFNTPPLRRLYERSLRKKNKAEAKQAPDVAS